MSSKFPTHVRLTRTIPSFGQDWKAGDVCRVKSITLEDGSHHLCGLNDLSAVELIETTEPAGKATQPVGTPADSNPLADLEIDL